VALREEMALPSGVIGPAALAALAAEASLPSAVMGPLDFAPLARDASMRSVELIFLGVLWQAVGWVFGGLGGNSLIWRGIFGGIACHRRDEEEPGLTGTMFCPLANSVRVPDDPPGVARHFPEPRILGA